MQVEADSGTTTLVYLMNPPYLSASLQQNVQRKRSFNSAVEVFKGDIMASLQKERELK